MNAERRKRIAQAEELVIQARVLLEGVRDDETEAFEAMPESLQDGERGQAMSDAAAALEGAVSSLEDVESSLAEAAS